MKKVFCSLVLIFCINIVAFPQVIDETIPKFAESLFALNETSVRNKLNNHVFRIFSQYDLINLGYDEESARKTIVGIGDENIICKVHTNSTGDSIERVIIGNARYLNARYMMGEYQREGYVMVEDASTNTELVFIKQTNEYIYLCSVEFAITPDVCITNTEFRRVKQKKK